uniref:Putative salivary scp/antigen 5 protein n=1 Tax=Panstrongylus lignarius TaxID=156445 RepID=A0A224XVU3_9HEMI
MAMTHLPLVFSLLALALIGSLEASTQLACKNSNILLGIKKITKKDKEKLLDAHNRYRELVASGKSLGQPAAQNMLVLSWDDYAAQKAFSWASKCKLRPTRLKNKYNQTMGQNLYANMTTRNGDVNTTFNAWAGEMVKAWYDQVKVYNFGPDFSEKTGHYTQLVWATTSKLGCGYSYFKKGEHWHVGYLVCNYDSSGNKHNQPPYIKGKVNCKAHDLVRSRKYNHLCVEKN